MSEAPPPRFEAPALGRLTLHVRHGFFGRQGGVSTGAYRSLNCGLGSFDELENVRENRRRVCRAIGAAPEALVSLRQIHSARAEILDGPYPAGQTPEADGLATKRPGLVLGIVTADCAPVLMCDPHAQVIGAAHAGWRGAVSGIAEATVAAMIRLGAAPQNIIAAIGPSLSQSSFEVGPDLVDAVLEATPWAEPYFVPGSGDRSHFDLKAYVASRLARLGVGLVEALADDTLGDPATFFSYRGAQNAGEKDAGRNLSVITLLP